MFGSTRALIGLSLLVVGLGLIAWFEPGLEPPATPEPRPLSPVDASSIEQLQLQRGELSLQFTRRHGEWWLEGEPDLPANRFRIDKLLALPGARERDRFALGDADPAAYGLAPPRARLEYGEALTVEVGGESPLGDARYLRIGETLHLIDSGFYFYLLGSRERFIAPTPLPPGWRLRAVEVSLAEGDWRLEQVEGRWQSAPQNLIQSADQAVALFSAWPHAQALQLTLLATDEVLNESIRLQLEDASSQAHELLFALQRGEQHWRLIRRDARLEYLLPAENAAQLIRIPEPEPVAGPEA